MRLDRRYTYIVIHSHLLAFDPDMSLVSYVLFGAFSENLSSAVSQKKRVANNNNTTCGDGDAEHNTVPPHLSSVHNAERSGVDHPESCVHSCKIVTLICGVDIQKTYDN